MLVAIAMIALQTTSREVSFQGVGGIELPGTLLMPEHTKNVPAFVLLSGSGPTDRDGSVPGMKIDVLRQVAERLASEGIASYRFDKRAVHTNSALWPKDMSQIPAFFSWDNFVGDAKLAHDFLMHQPGVDPNRVGMIGHSEGALIAMKLAADPANKVNGLIMLDGQGRPLDVVVMQQLREKLPQQLPADQVQPYLDAATKAIAQIKANGTVPPGMPAGLQGLFNISTLIFLQQNFKEKPLDLAAQYQGDVLVMNGELDNQVSPDLDAKALTKAFQNGKAKSVQLAIIPGAGHCLKATTSRDQNVMEGPMVPASLNTISAWCKKHM